MRKLLLAAVLVFAVMVLLVLSGIASAAVITSVREFDAEGTLVIRGAGFGKEAGQVFLGSRKLSIDFWKKKQVKAVAPTDIRPGTYLLTLQTAAGELFLMDVAFPMIGMHGPQGPRGGTGPQGDPGLPGTSISFYVAEGPPKMVPVGDTDTETLSCNPGDAVTGWAMEGAGVLAATAPVSAGLRSVIPVVSGSVPTGFTFHYHCNTIPTCDITNRIICADLAP